MSVLQSQAGVHQERIQEMRDTHKLEVESLNSELSNIRAEFSKQANELAGARQAFQEEEEKRQKSVNLLKAIRQKLTKAEQAKSEAEQERDKKANELITVKQQSESVINRIRTGFEREIVTLKGLHEKESAGKKSQAELELLTLKSIHSQELTSKRKRVEELEKHVAEMQSEKDDIFENGQQMETEVERARTWASDLESQLNEKSVQLQDALSQIESLQAEGVRTAVSQDGTSHNATVRQHQEALDALEKTYNAKVGALETQVSTLEASRSKAEAEMSATMESRLNEVERMRLDMRTNQSKLESVNAELQRWSDKANELERDAAELRLRNVGLEKSLETNQAESTRFNDCIVCLLGVSDRAVPH